MNIDSAKRRISRDAKFFVFLHTDSDAPYISALNELSIFRLQFRVYAEWLSAARKPHNSVTCNSRFPIPDFLLRPPLSLSLVYRRVIKSATRRLPPLSSYLRTRVLRIQPCMQISEPRVRPPASSDDPFSTTLQPFRVPRNEWTGLAAAESERRFAIMTLARGSTGILREGEHLKELLSIIPSYFTYRRYVVVARREYK